MPKSSIVASSLPPAAASALRELGENLAIARARRKESQRAWAQRIGISVPTLIRLEKGGIVVGVVAGILPQTPSPVRPGQWHFRFLPVVHKP